MWATRLTNMLQRRFQRHDDGSRREFHEPTILVTRRRSSSQSASQSDSITTAQQHQPATGDEHRSMPLLFNLCRRWAWPAIEFRCQSHPHEANAQDERGDTALHWVVFGNPPVAAIKALLTACPDLASVANRQGRLPLHLAASYRASSDVLRALVQAYPEGAATPMPRTRSLVLHALCDVGTSVDGIRAIVEADTASVQKCDGIFRRTPLQILNSRKSMSRYHSMTSAIRSIREAQDELRRDFATNRDIAEANLIHLELQADDIRQWDFWLKASLLIQAEYQCSPLLPDSDSTQRIVHACAGIRQCPPSLLEFATLLYPDQLMEQDEEGDVPLHKAAENYGNDILYDILMACPKASIVCNKRGKYPLNVAIKAGRRWKAGINLLVAANPVAVEGLDLDSRLYPLFWSNLSDPNALFLSIQSKPNFFSLRNST